MSHVDCTILIATYNMGHLIMDTIHSCLNQQGVNLHVVVYDDRSTDGTHKMTWPNGVKYVRAKKNAGVGAAFNAGMRYAKGKYLMLMCADDYFTNVFVVSDMIKILEENPGIGHVSRWYYQFIHGTTDAVRAWRTNDPIIQANNPSGLMFRRKALKGCKCSNRMFIETTQLVSQVCSQGWGTYILPYDALAVRVHGSTSTQPGYWLKRRVSSPVIDWHQCGGDMTKDYVSLIQIRVGANYACLFEEIRNFIKLRRTNLINPKFWFWVLISVLMPRWALVKLPQIYRRTIGKWTTKKILRPSST